MSYKSATLNEALRLYVNGEHVEYKYSDTWQLLTGKTPVEHLVFASFRVRSVITINGFSINKPETVKPKDKTTVYVVSTDSTTGIRELEWDNSDYMHTLLYNGLIHLRKESAVSHYTTLIKASLGESI